MRLFRGILYVLIGLIASAVAATVLVVATPYGLRMAVDVAEPYLPSALDLGEVDGTLASGVIVKNAAWRDARVTVEIEELELALNPWPLIRRDVRLRRLHARGVSVDIGPAPPEEQGAATDDGPFRFRMPVPLAVRDARLEDVRVSGPGWTRTAERIELAAAMRESRLSVDRLAIASDWLEVQTRGDATLAPPYRLSLDADWRYPLDGQALAGSGRLEGDAGAWQVRHRLSEPLDVASEGTLSLGEAGFRARLVNDLGQLEWQLQDGRALSVADGRITVEGWLDGFDAEARARLTVDGMPAVQAEASGGGSLQAVVVERLRLQSESGNVAAEGRLSLWPAREWDLGFRLATLQTGAWGAPVEARISAEGRTAGRWPADAAPHGEITVETLAGEYRGEPLSGAGTVALDTGGRAQARNLELTVGDNRFTVDGQLTPQPDLRLAIQAPRLAVLWPDLEGDLRGDMAISGTFAAPVLDGTLETEGLRRDGLAVGSGTLEIAPADVGTRLRVTAGEVRIDDLTLTSLRAEAKGTPEAQDLALEFESAGGEVELRTRGGTADGAWSGQLLALRVTQPQLGDWRLDEPAELAVAPDQVSLERACLTGEGRGSLCLEGARDETAARIAAEARRVPVALLAPLFPAGSSFEGEAAGGANLTWQAGVLDGSAELTVEDARIGVLLDEDQQAAIDIRSFTARAMVERNRADVEANLDLGEQGDGAARLRSADLFDPDAALDGRVQLDFRDLSMVPLLVPEVTEVSGHILGRVEVAGTRREPSLGGALRLREAGFLFPDAGIEITELEVVARQTRPGLIDYEGSARSGDGDVTIRGSTRRGNGEGWMSRFTVQGSDFQVVRLPDMRATASPDLQIVLDESRLEVRGSIEVPEADITLREAGPDAVRTSPDAVVHGRTEAGEERLGPVLYVEVQVSLGEAVQLRGFGLETGLTGSLRLTGGSQRPWLGFGRLSLVDARYSAYGQELTVERGELAFSGPLDNPALDIRAVRDAGEVVAGVRIGGTVRAPSSTVFSEPPLPEAEALSYLLTGRPLSGTTTAEGNVLSRAAMSLGLSRAGAIASEISQEVGLDTLAVEGGAGDGRVLAGKRLGEDLYLEYAWGIFDSIGTLLVRYDLSDRLRLESRTGEQHSVDLVYRVKSD